MTVGTPGSCQRCPTAPFSTLPPTLILPRLKAGLQHLSWEPHGTLVPGSSGLMALVASGQASLPRAPAALQMPPAGPTFLAEQGVVGLLHQDPPRLWGSSSRASQEKGPAVPSRPPGSGLQPRLGLGAAPLSVLPLHLSSCGHPGAKPTPLSSTVTHLTCTNRGFIMVSTRPCAGTAGISWPQSSLELSASVLTVMFTCPVDARETLSVHGNPQPTLQPHRLAPALGLCGGLAGLRWGSPG